MEMKIEIVSLSKYSRGQFVNTIFEEFDPLPPL
jgi:hypothetical protein